jgi:hypothetical protein
MLHMAIIVRCECGRVLKARDDFGGSRAMCPSCGRTVEIPTASEGGDVVVDRQPDEAAPTQIKEFLDPPMGGEAKTQAGGVDFGGAGVGAAVAAKPSVVRRMFEALLDPRAIQWMLMIGGALCVLGIIVWLVSKGIFEDKLVLASAMGAGTLAILGGGWYTALRTRFRVAGQALTFLGCVVAPLNLWFYHYQNLVTVQGHLWVGGVVCCLLYAATVWTLRDPLFVYACEAGVTLTAILLLADLNQVTDTAWLSLFLMALGLISIHGERAFSAAETAEFPRKRYGLPMFWSGHVQMAASLLILLGSQLLGWLKEPAAALFGIHWPGNLLTNNHMLAAGVWLAAVYAYLYSDIVVRRVGVYLALAGFALVMAEATLLLGFDVQAEWIIAAMAITSVGINVAHAQWGGQFKHLDRFVPPLGAVLGLIPVLWGVVLHMRATSTVVDTWGWSYPTDGAFAAVMLVAAAANRASAWMLRHRDRRTSIVYFALSAISLLIAAAGLLRVMGLVVWSQQAPWMMLIPIGYMIASRLWRGHTAEWPLYWVAQGATAAILLNVFGATLNDNSFNSFAPMEGLRSTLMLGLVFAEAAAFYLMGALFHRRSINIHLAAAAACGALWQLMGYFGVPSDYYTMLYATLGVVALALGRSMGLEQVDVYSGYKSVVFEDGYRAKKIRGRGLPAFQSGNGILCVALLAAFMQGLSGMVRTGEGWLGITSLAMTIAAAGLAAVIVPAANWRRFYMVAATALAGVLFLRLNMLLDLSGWQKLEIFCVVAGLAMLIGSHLALFREEDGRREDPVSFGLLLGSVLAVAPLLISVLYHRWSVGHPSLIDEIGLLTVTILLSVTGVAWQVKATTVLGGGALVLYLAVLVCSLAYHPQVAIGVYLAVGGAVVFGLGVALSIYRDKLLELPEAISKREGVFRILNWR